MVHSLELISKHLLNIRTFVGFMVILLALLPGVVFGGAWGAKWGSIDPKDGRGEGNFEIHLPDGSKYPVGYGTSAGDIIDNVCVPARLPEQDCEILVDSFFSTWYSSAYAPRKHVERWEQEYFATRATIIAVLQERYQYQHYLEIGTNDDVVFNIAKLHFKTAVGVDPNMGGTLRMTSDAFFKTNSDYFDLIFVDGLHEANQVYRDVRRSLDKLLPNGTIVMHDCNPRGDLDLTAAFPRPEGATIWNGDTWKAAVALRLEKNLEIVIVDIDQGVGVVRRRPNRHPLPPDLVEYLGVSPISMLDNQLFRNRKSDLFRMMTIQEFVDWLDEEEAGN